MTHAARRRLLLPALLAAALVTPHLVPVDASASRPTETDGVGVAAAGRSAIYGGGPFYSDGQAVMNTLRASGFTTVILWSIHVRTNGDLWYNDHLIVANGQYVGDPGWPARLRTLKQAPTSVNRIEVSVGSAGPDDWGTIDSLIRAQGTGPGSILYRNLQALRTATGADAVNDDDEQHYDPASTTAFARMAAAQGYKFTFAPYTNMTFWANLKSALGGTVDRVYLQNYAGGTGNDPRAWSNRLGMPVDPGLWSRHGTGCAAGDSPASVQSRMSAWHASAGIPGGFIWLYDDIKACAGQGSAAAYAAAVNNGTGSGGGASVQLYQHCSFVGWAAGFTAPGNYTAAQIQAAGGRTDDASSLRIPAGVRVTLFDGDNFTGRSTVLTSNESCLVARNFNDVVSSIRIERS